ncbi:MAG: arylsulfatase [Halioglobus sp.]
MLMIPGVAVSEKTTSARELLAANALVVAFCLACLMLLALPASATAEQTRAATARPNLVLIVVDDMGFSDFGAFGSEINTPNIDALAASGTRFSNFHVASSCAPTRAMLMTGVDNHVAGIGSMRELMPLSHRGKPGYEGVLNGRVQTFATHLQSAGYRTLVAGKWHLGVGSDNLPPARGFDYSFIQADSGSDNFEMRPYLPMQAEARWFENGARLTSLPDDFYSSAAFVDKTIEQLKASPAQNTPFFAYLAFQANHTPLQAPAHFVDAYRGAYEDGWAVTRQARIERLQDTGLLSEGTTLAPGPTQEAWDALDAQQQYFEARRMQAYAGMATAMDHEVGRLVDHLRKTGQHENTVYVVFSDNGAVANEPYENDFGRRWLEKHFHREVETLGTKGSWVAAGRYWGRVSNTPFAGVKFTAGEGGLRVPLIVSGKALASSTKLSHAFVHVTDIAPTLLALAGEPAAMHIAQDRSVINTTGKSVLPLLNGQADAIRSYSESIGYEFSGNAALFRGDFKITRNFPPAGDNRWRLYNLKEDPGETQDLSGRLATLYETMQDDYAEYADTVGVLPMPEDYELAKQVMINTIVFNTLPRMLPYLGAGLAVVFALYLYRRRQRSAATGAQ